MGLFDPVAAMIFAARAVIVICSVLPRLKISPTVPGEVTHARMPSITSLTCPKQRDCSPVPNTVTGSADNAWRTNVGSTIPYCPVWRGPAVLNSRTMVTGSFFSR